MALAYLRHFGERAQAVVQHDGFRRILNYDASQQLFQLLHDPRSRFKFSLILGTLTNITHLNGQGRGRLYLNVGHTGLDSTGFNQWVSSANVKPIYLVHDLIPITHPQFCRHGEDRRHRDRMLTVLLTAAGVIGNSKATVEALASFAQSERQRMPPSIGAWLGTDLPRILSAHPPRRATFVTVGTIEGRKNHMLLLKIWSRLVERLGSDAPQLLLIGGRGWEAEPVFKLLDRNDSLRDHVVELNQCSDEELSKHLTRARALLFPSLAEGYGLPLVEALGAGIPVIASDLPVFRELGGDVPLYIHPHDEKAWEGAILDYTNHNSSSRSAQLDRIRGFRSPDWESHFAAVESWLGTLR